MQNLFAMRFGNALFEPIWRREHIANIQITIAEDLGVEKRGAFYDQTGALREAWCRTTRCSCCARSAWNRRSTRTPTRSATRSSRCCARSSPGRLRRWACTRSRGQYTAGTAYGERVQGYRDEPGVDRESRTETFVALRTEIANWRWAGVPFYIRTGKRLASRDARIEVNFRPTRRMRSTAHPSGSANKFVINLQPKDGLELHMLAQAQDNRQRSNGNQDSAPQLAPVQLDLDFDKRFGSERVGAYERPAARRDRRPPQPVRAQRRAGRGMALGRAADRQLGLRRRTAPLCGRHLGPSASSAMIARRFLVGRGTVTSAELHAAHAERARLEALVDGLRALRPPGAAPRA